MIVLSSSCFLPQSLVRIAYWDCILSLTLSASLLEEGEISVTRKHVVMSGLLDRHGGLVAKASAS